MQQHGCGAIFQHSSAEPASSTNEELNKRLQEFLAYIGDYDHSQEQAIALLQLAVKTAEPGSAKKSARLEWPNVYAAIATLTRTDSQTLHARLTIGFSPVEFKWMLQNKAVYTWHSNPVRFQRCLQCMVAKLGMSNGMYQVLSKLRHTCCFNLSPLALQVSVVAMQKRHAGLVEAD